MSSEPTPSLHPIIVVEDRYDGCYSSGRWWAVAMGDEPFHGTCRIAWLMENGPGSDDVSCAFFWGNPPAWIAAAATPDEAVAKLIAQPAAEADDWAPPKWQDDPRSQRWLRFLASEANVDSE